MKNQFWQSSAITFCHYFSYWMEKFAAALRAAGECAIEIFGRRFAPLFAYFPGGAKRRQSNPGVGGHPHPCKFSNHLAAHPYGNAGFNKFVTKLLRVAWIESPQRSRALRGVGPRVWAGHRHLTSTFIYYVQVVPVRTYGVR